MLIDFFKDKCKSSSNSHEFGICDDIKNNTEIAYIDEKNQDNWVGIVSNASQCEASFYAIDHCVPLLRVDGNQENRCDGLLHYNSKLIFIELKERAGGKWARDGREQIANSFRIFKANYNINSFSKIEAYICNKSKPQVNQMHASKLEEFKDQTGIILKIQQRIQI